jgi:hypothetical protein
MRVVEDEFLIAARLEAVVQEHGHETIGPVSTVDVATSLVA